MIKHMISASATTTTTTTTASILRTVVPPPLPHEYLRETLSIRYQECKSCRNRTQLACIKCGYCYTCHWKEEEKKKGIESEQLLPRQKNDDDDISSNSTTVVGRGEIAVRQYSNKANIIIDVFGQKVEPICNYYRCHHKFSLHGCKSHTSCHCKHPVNSIIGVSKNVH